MHFTSLGVPAPHRISQSGRDTNGRGLSLRLTCRGRLSLLSATPEDASSRCLSRVPRFGRARCRSARRVLPRRVPPQQLVGGSSGFVRPSSLVERLVRPASGVSISCALSERGTLVGKRVSVSSRNGGCSVYVGTGSRCRPPRGTPSIRVAGWRCSYGAGIRPRALRLPPSAVAVVDS